MLLPAACLLLDIMLLIKTTILPSHEDGRETFRGTTSLRRVLIAAHSLPNRPSKIADQVTAVTGVPVPFYFRLGKTIRFLRQSLRTTFGGQCLRGLSARATPSLATSTCLLLPEIDDTRLYLHLEHRSTEGGTNFCRTFEDYVKCS